MINRILRALERRKKTYIFILCLLFVIYFFIRNPELETLSMPTFSVTENEVYEETEVYLSNKEGAAIYYEIIDLKQNKSYDNVEVNLLSNKFTPDKPIKLEYDTEIEILAFAYKKGYNDSEVAKQRYKAQRKESEPTINAYNNNTIAISGSFAANIYYTLDGSDPDLESETTKRYTGRFKIDETTTIKAIATKQNYFSSDIITKTIEIKEEEKTEEEIKYYTFKTAIKGKGNIINEENNLGDTIKVEAVPAAGWEFVGWSGDISGNERKHNINLINNTGKDDTKSVIAEFRKIVSYYNYKINIIGQGEVKEINSGNILEVEAVPAAGWEFVGWAGDITGDQYKKEVILLSNEVNPGTKHITAEFMKIELVSEMNFELTFTPVKIINDGVNKIILSKHNNNIFLYNLKQDKSVRWKYVNELIFEKQIDVKMVPVDIIAENNEYLILSNYNGYPYIINVRKDTLDYFENKIDLKNTEAKVLKKYGNYYIIGCTYNNGNERKFSISLIDKNFDILLNMLSYNKDNNTQFESLNDIIIDNQNNIIAVGSTIDSLNKDIFISKLSTEGIIFEEAFGSRNNDVGLLVNSINDNLIIAAESNNIYKKSLDYHKGYNILLEKRDKENKLIKRKVIGGTDNYYPVELIVKDNYIYLLGNNDSKNNMIVVRLDKNLSEEKIKTFDNEIGISMSLNNNNIDILTLNNNKMNLVNINLNFFTQER